MIAPPPDLAPDQLWLPTRGRAIPRPWFLPSKEVLEAQRRIMESTYFLCRVKGNASLGENLFCDPAKGGCGARGKNAHDTLTLRCVPLPFSGVSGGLFAYVQAVGDNGLYRMLSPSERVRYEGMRQLLGGVPDVSTSHPQLAAKLTAGLGPADAQLAAYALGILEPIPPTLARKYAERINARGVRPKFVLPGIAGRP